MGVLSPPKPPVATRLLVAQLFIKIRLRLKYYFLLHYPLLIKKFDENTRMQILSLFIFDKKTEALSFVLVEQQVELPVFVCVHSGVFFLNSGYSVFFYVHLLFTTNYFINSFFHFFQFLFQNRAVLKIIV